MGWYLDLHMARTKPVSPEASEVIRLLANGVMPPVNGTVLSATMELIEEDILLHTDAKSREDLFKTLAKTLPDE
jgi:hypothetical protein